MKALSTDQIISKVCFENEDIDIDEQFNIFESEDIDIDEQFNIFESEDIDIDEQFNMFENEDIDELENNTSLHKNNSLLVTPDVIVVLSIIKQIFIFIWFNK